jgi:Oligosaccharide biosynthesis protein Alg14 like
MAFTYKVLGQAAPTDTNNANLYTVPSATSAVASSLVIANTTGTAATARVFVRIAGAAAATSNAIVYDTSIAANSTLSLSLGMSLATTDVVTVRTGTLSALTFTLFGSEIA